MLQKGTKVAENVKASAPFLLLAEIIFGLFLVLLTVIVFFKLGENILDQDVAAFDLYITQFVYFFRTPFMTEVMFVVTFFGGEIFLGTAIIVTTFLLLFYKHKKDALVFGFILFTGIGLNVFLKSLYQRPRPEFLPLAEEATASFPSGHAMNSFFFYTCLSYIIFRKLKNRRLKMFLLSGSAFLVFLIGVSRIYLGVHFPSDVIAGFAAGLCWFVIVLMFERSIMFLRLFTKREVEKKY